MIKNACHWVDNTGNRPAAAVCLGAQQAPASHEKGMKGVFVSPGNDRDHGERERERGGTPWAAVQASREKSPAGRDACKYGPSLPGSHYAPSIAVSIVRSLPTGR